MNVQYLDGIVGDQVKKVCMRIESEERRAHPATRKALCRHLANRFSTARNRL
jgi:hypothetical protein